MNEKTKTHLSAAKHKKGWQLQREGKPLPTPQKKEIVLPAQALAEAIVQEWSRAERYSTRAMPLTAIAFSAVDVVGGHAEKMVDAMMAYAETDLLLYRSEAPELAARQAHGWDPVLDFIRARFDCELLVTQGVMPIEQPEETFARLRKPLASFDAFTMAAFSVLTQQLGSLMLAFAVKEGHADLKKAFRLSRVDEDFQAEKWGEDSVNLARAKEIERDAAAAARFLALLNG